MRRIRLPVAILIVWLFFFYNLERLNKHINFTTAAYIMVPAVVVIIVLVPSLIRVNLWVLLVTPILIFSVLEIGAATDVWGNAILLTLTEICAIAITAILARWVSIGVNEFEIAVINMTIGRGNERRTRQGEIYQEVQRARIHQRPLSLMALKADETSVNIAIDRIVREAQQAMVKQYALGGVSKTLVQELPDYNIVARRNDHLLVLLPEATPEQLPAIIEQLQNAVSRQVGISIKVGTASLPEDATTFESLLEKAVRDMEAQPTLARWPQRPTTSPVLDNASLRENPNGHDGR